MSHRSAPIVSNSRLLLLVGALIAALPMQLMAQPLTIGGYSLVRERRVSNVVSEYEYRVTIANGGATTLELVNSTLVSLLPTTSVVDGALRFDNVPARGTRTSTDTFVVRRPRLVPLTPGEFVWTTSVNGAFTIGKFSLVRERRVNALVSDFDYTAELASRSVAIPGATATVVGASPATTVVEGSLTFAAVAAGASRRSSDTFTVRRLRSVPLVPAVLAWTIVPGGQAGNRPPVARVAPLSTPAQPGVALNLDGSTSSDPDGTPIASYAWRLASRPATSQAALSATTATATFTPDVTGSYTVELTVSDGTLTGSASLTFSTANRAPTAAIGALAPAFVAQPLGLTGSASSDPDGDSLSYAWTVLSRPAGSVVGIQNATAAAASFTPDRAGAYQVQLAVSDGSLTSTATASFATGNTRPVANPGSAQSAVVGATVTLDGSQSTDVDGDVLTYAWAVTLRPPASASDLSDPAAVMPTFRIDAAGTYTFQLVVRDANGALSLPATVAVSTINSPPTANAGPDQNVVGGALVQLSGQQSSDADGDPLTYAWAFVQVPAGSAATLTNPGSLTPSFVADRRGTFIIRLTVSDPSGARASDDVRVSTANTPPVATAGPDQSVVVGTTVLLDGSGSTDVDGDTLSYAWSFTTRPAGSGATLSADNVPSPTFGVDRPGTYVLQLLVSDGAGGTHIDTVVITTANSRPTANAGPDQSVVAGRSVTLDGRGSADPDFDPLTYAWALTTIPPGSGAVLSDATVAQPTFVADLPGTYVAQLTVSDGVLASTTDTVAVATGNTAPVADAGTDPPRMALGGQVALDGLGSSDADGHALTYAWAILSRPAGSLAALTGHDTRTPSFTPDLGGDYVVQLIVNDGFGNSPPDTVVVRVNRPPVADAGADRAGAVGAPVMLSGTGTDADNDPLTFAWTLTVPSGSAASLANALSATARFVPDVAGAYTARLVVHDGFNSSGPDDVVVTVTVTQALSLAPPSTNLLALANGTLTVTSTAPAGAGGLVVALASDNTAVASTPASVTIPQGQSSTTFDVTSGTTAGSAQITASAPGSSSGSAAVAVSLRGMTVGLAAPTVVANQAVAGTVTLTQPAPAGGVTIALGSSNPTAVSVLSPSVAIAAGGTSAGFSVFGAGIGAANLLASAPGFASASAPVTSSLNLTLGPAPFDVERAATRTATLSMNGPAPAGGLTVTLTSDDPSRATVPASVTVPAGLSILDFAVTGVSEGTTTVRAAAAGVQGATLAVIVIPPSAAEIDSSPANGEGSVAVTRETILRFSRPIANPQLIAPQTLFAQFGGQMLSSRIHVSPDRRTVTLFYLQTLPASARVRVQFQTDGLIDDLGVPLDGNRDGQPGGLAQIDFDTLTLTTLPGTAVAGRVFASQLGDGGVNTPLAGVVVSVDGLETTLRTTTDAMGNFQLNPAPLGEFFVHIDGRAATNGVPVGAYYPIVGKKWESKAQQTITLPDVFLPLIVPGTLQPVSQTQDTVITFPTGVIAQDARLVGVQLTVLADALYSDSGARGGMVGIAPVAPDRIPSPLPSGLAFPLVITVQTDGATNFDRPVHVCFPNLPDPTTGRALAPGAKSALWSFNHDSGDWEVVGPVTVSSSGSLACSDPGTGILQPGWHGVQPGTQAGSRPTLDAPPDPLTCPPTVAEARQRKWKSRFGGTESVLGWLAAHYLSNQIATGLVCDPLPTLGRWLCEQFIPDLVDFRNRWEGAYQRAKRAADFYENCEAGGDLGAGGPMPAPLPAGLEATFQSAIDDTNSRIQAHLDLSTQIDLIRGSEANWGSLSAAQQASLQPLLLQGYQNTAGTDVGEFFLRRLEQIATLWQTLEARLGSYAPSAQQRFLFSVSLDSLTAPIIRGESDSGSIPRLVLRPDASYSLRVLSTATGRKGFVRFRTSGATVRTMIPTVVTTAVDGPDADADGLDDVAESVAGTNHLTSDSDGDGLSDLAELQQGANPLDGAPARTGILASVSLPGGADAVDVAARDDTVAVANGMAGVAILNTANVFNPVVVARVDTPGNAQAVAIERERVAVADGSSGLAVIDISDPPAARILYQLGASTFGGSTTAVVMTGQTVYVGSSTGHVVAIDVTSGAELGRVSLLSPVQDLAIEGDVLYALTLDSLNAVLLDGLLTVSGSAANIGVAPGPRARLFVGGGIAYATQRGGYNTFSLSDPRRPVAIAVGSTGQLGWRQIVATESGLGVAVVGANSSSERDVSLYDVSNPANTNVFITEFSTPGGASAVAIYGGVGFVADGAAGLQVVNYRAFDTGRAAPNIALTSNYLLNSASGLAEEGKRMRVTALVSDDVQVRNVDFFVNAVRVARDGNFPFEVAFTTPSLAQATVFSVRACAYDTGGNSSCTADVPVTLTADATPPAVTVWPGNGALVLPSSVVVAQFSEPVQAALVSAANIKVFFAGPDGQVATADDVDVTGTVTYDSVSNRAVLNLSTPPRVGAYRGVVLNSIRDLAGNPLVSSFTWDFRFKGAATWIRDASGFWDDAANWSDGLVPQAGENVVIDRPLQSVIITVRIPTAAVASLRSTEQLVVNSSLTVDGVGLLDGGLVLTGQLAGAGTTYLRSPGTWSGGGLLSTTLVVEPGQVMTAVNPRLVDGRLINEGTVLLTGGLLGYQGNSGVTNTSQGIWDVSGSQGMTSFGSGAQTFFNAGLLRRTSGAGDFNIGQTGFVVFNNTGTVDIQTGTLLVRSIAPWANSGLLSVGAGAVIDLSQAQLEVGSTFTGAGTLTIPGTTTLAADVTVPLRTTLTGSLVGPGGWTVGAPFTWSSGGLVGSSLTVPAGQVLTGNPRLVDSRLINNGTVFLTDRLTFQGNSSVTNAVGGIWDVSGSQGMTSNGAGTQTFVNAGVLRRTTGAGDFNIGQTGFVAFTNTGTVDIQTGTLLVRNVPPWTNRGLLSVGAGAVIDLSQARLEVGSTFAGTGTVTMPGTTTLATDVTVPVRTTLTGSLVGPGEWTVGAPFTWSSGGLVGSSLTVPAGQVLTGNPRLVDSRLINNGTVLLTDRLTFQGNSSVTNAVGGIWDVSGSAGMTSNGGGTQTFVNAGLLRRTTGAGDFNIGFNGSVVFTNTGTVDIQTGTLLVRNGPWTNSGLLSVGAGAVIDLSQARLEVGSTFTGAGTLTMPGATTLATDVTVPVRTTLTGSLVGPGAWTVAAPFTWSSAGSLVGASLTVPAGQVLTMLSPRLTNSTVTNAGTVQWTGGQIAGQNGTLINAVGGVWDASGNEPITLGGASTFTNAGLFRRTGGTGVLNLSSVRFDNTGTLRMRIGGTAAGQFDQLVLGATTLGGTLDVELIGGFVPNAGNAFGLINYSTRSGTFGTILGNGQTYTPVYGATTLTLTKQ